MQWHAWTPAFDSSPFITIWQLVTTFCILITIFPQYVKFVEFVMVQVVGSVEDDKCISILAFMKFKLYNGLRTHLPLVV